MHHKDQDKDQVTVSIRFSERVTYSAEVTMSREQFEQLECELENERGADLRRAEERIAEFCDRARHWEGSDDIDIEDFVLVSSDAA